MRIVSSITKETAKYKIGNGCEKIVTFNPEIATCCQIHTIFHGFTAAQLERARERVQEATNIRVYVNSLGDTS